MGPDDTDSFTAIIIEMRRLLKDFEDGNITFGEFRSQVLVLLGISQEGTILVGSHC